MTWLVSWLGFCATELRKHLLWPLVGAAVPVQMRDEMRRRAPAKPFHLNNHLSGRNYLLGDRFSAADAYLAWFLLLVPVAGSRSRAGPGRT